MFDRFMESSMALWLLVSAAYPFFIIAMVVKAVRHYRRQRSFPTLWVGPKPTPPTLWVGPKPTPPTLWVGPEPTPAAYVPSRPERRRPEPPTGDWTPSR